MLPMLQPCGTDLFLPCPGSPAPAAALRAIGLRPACHRFLPLSGFLTPRSCVLSDMGGGGFGITPAWPSNLPTVCDGCAPTDIQYLRSIIDDCEPRGWTALASRDVQRA